MAQTLWSSNSTCACMYTFGLIMVEFQASGWTRLCLRDGKKAERSGVMSHLGSGTWDSWGHLLWEEFTCMSVKMASRWLDGQEIYGWTVALRCEPVGKMRVWKRRFNVRSISCVYGQSVWPYRWRILLAASWGEMGWLICPVCASLPKTFMKSGKGESLIWWSISRCSHERDFSHYTLKSCIPRLWYSSKAFRVSPFCFDGIKPHWKTNRDKTEESYFSINLGKETLGPLSDLQGSQSQQRSDLLIPQLLPPAPPAGHRGSPQSDETHQLPSAIRIWPWGRDMAQTLATFHGKQQRVFSEPPLPQPKPFVHSLCAGLRLKLK